MKSQGESEPNGGLSRQDRAQARSLFESNALDHMPEGGVELSKKPLVHPSIHDGKLLGEFWASAEGLDVEDPEIRKKLTNHFKGFKGVE